MLEMQVKINVFSNFFLSERLLFQWADQYLNDNYRPVGLVNMPPQGPTEYYLPMANAEPELAENFIIIFHRS